MDICEYSQLKRTIEIDPLWYQNEQIIEYINIFKKDALTKYEKSQKRNITNILKTIDFVKGETGYNWDQWRLPIDCAVIHHTSSSPTISLEELNILGLRLYIEQYPNDDDVKNKPLYSGHYWYGKQKVKNNMTFVSYHYLVRPSGKIIQLVDDLSYLWHAGDLEINRKSIGIALAGKFIDKKPTTEATLSVVKIIQKHNIDKNRIFGHSEVINKKILGETTCPGNTFIDGWKNDILALFKY